ncbi:hypothetical protein [Kitasatospora sp. NBC_01300]|uniref:hypothetical protein n=1 Tax=Kitasatospora sp. NBC_01300 TaxID=2903574 RepID=UPI00352E7F90|nr:hypothetical protein OG556_04620 [Kitasatospora sp. NBC_01300]
MHLGGAGAEFGAGAGGGDEGQPERGLLPAPGVQGEGLGEEFLDLCAAVGAALGVGLGVLRGATVTLFERDGVAWQRYTGRTFLVAAGSLVVMAGFGFLAGRFGLAPDARPVQLSIGVGFLGEALAVGCRVLVAGLPFAPERRDLNLPLGTDRIRR